MGFAPRFTGPHVCPLDPPTEHISLELWGTFMMEQRGGQKYILMKMKWPSPQPIPSLLQENTDAKSTGDSMWACVGPQCVVGGVSPGAGISEC